MASLQSLQHQGSKSTNIKLLVNIKSPRVDLDFLANAAGQNFSKQCSKNVRSEEIGGLVYLLRLPPDLDAAELDLGTMT